MDEDEIAIGWAMTTKSPTGQLIVDRLRGGQDPMLPGDIETIRLEWTTGRRAPYEPHAHQTVVDFADGASVTAVSLLGDDQNGREKPPDFGLYFDEHWNSAWPHEQIAWPDLGVPDTEELKMSLKHLLDRARGGQAVEIGCLGGHGRTGTALAALAVLTGTPPDKAVEWVRAQYCDDAIETLEQISLIETFLPT